MKDHNLVSIMQMTEDEAREMLEEIRWSNGIYCPKCGSKKGAWKLESKPESKNKIRPGVYKCKDCRKKFTVTIGTIFEGSHIPLNKWLAAIYLMNSHKKGYSAHNLHRDLGISYKSAWFLCHRIRHAMTEAPLGKLLGIVEADETYVGGKRKKNFGGRSTKQKTPVFALVERGGNVRAQTVPDVTAKTLMGIMQENIESDTRLMTDSYSTYRRANKVFPKHQMVDHLKEYARGDIHTNTVEGWFSLLKRGINGTFHHVSKEHLDRYVQEFQFRYNNRELTDGERMVKAIKGANGKRLVYKDTVKKDLPS